MLPISYPQYRTIAVDLYMKMAPGQRLEGWAPDDENGTPANFGGPEPRHRPVFNPNRFMRPVTPVPSTRERRSGSSILRWTRVRDSYVTGDVNDDEIETWMEKTRGAFTEEERKARPTGRPKKIRPRLAHEAPCSDDDCDRAAHSRGMCSTHYSRWYRRTKS